MTHIQKTTFRLFGVGLYPIFLLKPDSDYVQKTGSGSCRKHGSGLRWKTGSGFSAETGSGFEHSPDPVLAAKSVEKGGFRSYYCFNDVVNSEKQKGYGDSNPRQ